MPREVRAMNIFLIVSPESEISALFVPGLLKRQIKRLQDDLYFAYPSVQRGYRPSSLLFLASSCLISFENQTL